MKLSRYFHRESSPTKGKNSTPTSPTAQPACDASRKKITAPVVPKKETMLSKFIRLIGRTSPKKQTPEQQMFSILRCALDSDVKRVQKDLRDITPQLAMSDDNAIKEFVTLLKTGTLTDRGFKIALMQMLTRVGTSYQTPDMQALVSDEKLIEAVQSGIERFIQARHAYDTKKETKYFALFFDIEKTEHPENVIALLSKATGTEWSKDALKQLEKSFHENGVKRDQKKREKHNLAIKNCELAKAAIIELLTESELQTKSFLEKIEHLPQHIQVIEKELKNVKNDIYKRKMNFFLKKTKNEFKTGMSFAVQTILTKKILRQKKSSQEYISKLLDAYQRVFKEEKDNRIIQSAQEYIAQNKKEKK